MKVRKALGEALVACLALSMGMLAGCGAPVDEEQAVRDVIAANFDEVKNADNEFQQSVAQGFAATAGDTFDADAIAASIMEGFDYSIDEVTVDGDKAQAQVMITCKRMTDLNTKVTEAVTELTSSMVGSDVETIQAAYADKVLDIFNETVPTESGPYEIALTKENGSWVLGSSSVTSALLEAFDTSGMMG